MFGIPTTRNGLSLPRPSQGREERTGQCRGDHQAARGIARLDGREGSAAGLAKLSPAL